METPEAMLRTGMTGHIFSPGQPPELGEFIPCKIIELMPDGKLRVENKTGESTVVNSDEFKPMYFVGSNRP